MSKCRITLIISIFLNLVLILALILISFKESRTNYVGLYQATYYNNYNKQIILNIRLKDDNTCTYGEFAAEHASEGVSTCKYEVNGKKIKISLYRWSDNEEIKEGQILDNGNLFIDGKQLNKID